MADFAPGDIVVIEHHVRKDVIGRTAEVIHVCPKIGATERGSWLAFFAPPDVTWYSLIDCEGENRAAAHPWLRRVDPLWTPGERETEREAVTLSAMLSATR